MAPYFIDQRQLRGKRWVDTYSHHNASYDDGEIEGLLSRAGNLFTSAKLAPLDTPVIICHCHTLSWEAIVGRIVARKSERESFGGGAERIQQRRRCRKESSSQTSG